MPRSSLASSGSACMRRNGSPTMAAAATAAVQPSSNNARSSRGDNVPAGPSRCSGAATAHGRRRRVDETCGSTKKDFVKSTLMAASLVLFTLLAFWAWTPDQSRSLLESRYLGAPADMVSLAGLQMQMQLHVRDSGPRDAPAIVLIHGFGGSLQTWDAWPQGLAGKHRVVRFDLPGSGLSPPDPTGDYTDARSITLVLTLMDQLGLARASIVGHSIGGRIAWTLAAKHPDRVDKLVLVSPDGFASPGFEYGKAPEVPAVLGLMRYVLPKVLLRMNLAPAYADPARVSDEVLDRYSDLVRAPERARRCWTACVRPCWSTRVRCSR